MPPTEAARAETGAANKGICLGESSSAGDKPVNPRDALRASRSASVPGRAWTSCSDWASSTDAAVNTRIAMKSGLSRALERGEFSLVYQPKVCVRSGEIEGVEARALHCIESVDLVGAPADLQVRAGVKGVVGHASETTPGVATSRRRCAPRTRSAR